MLKGVGDAEESYSRPDENEQPPLYVFLAKYREGGARQPEKTSGGNSIYPEKIRKGQGQALRRACLLDRLLSPILWQFQECESGERVFEQVQTRHAHSGTFLVKERQVRALSAQLLLWWQLLEKDGFQGHSRAGGLPTLSRLAVLKLT